MLEKMPPENRKAYLFKRKVIADPKRARTRDTLGVVMLASSPLRSYAWWVIKHPISRVATVVFVMLANFYVYLGDPASYSNSKSYGTLVGDIYHGFFQPDEPAWVVSRVIFMLLLMVGGARFGVYIHSKWLRDRFHLTLFGYDNGLEPERDPILNTDGAFFIVFCTVSMTWFVGIKLYAAALAFLEVDPSHIPDGGMHGWDYAGYNLALAGLLTFACDWYTLVAVVDSMLQAVDSEQGVGYLAYAAAPAGSGGCGGPARRSLRLLADWWDQWRLTATRLLLLVGWPPVLAFMVKNYFEIEAVLSGGSGSDGAPLTRQSVGLQWAWSREWNTEHMRMLAAALVAFLNLVIVAQVCAARGTVAAPNSSSSSIATTTTTTTTTRSSSSSNPRSRTQPVPIFCLLILSSKDWDFPDLSDGEGVKIVAVDFSAIKCYVPAGVVNLFFRCAPDSCAGVLGFYVSAKWFNYFGIMLGVGFDWAYWFMTALCFRPCDYAQLWDSETGLIYSMTDRGLQERFAGHQSAKNCSWFTDNGVQVAQPPVQRAVSSVCVYFQDIPRGLEALIWCLL